MSQPASGLCSMPFIDRCPAATATAAALCCTGVARCTGTEKGVERHENTLVQVVQSLQLHVHDMAACCSSVDRAS